MVRRALTTALAVAAVTISSVASGALVRMDGFVGTWQNVTGTPAGLNFTGNGGNNPEAHWGTPAGGSQSGYVLNLAPPPPTPIDKTVPPATGAFFIGDFTHQNQPIASGTSITGVDLKISFDIQIDTGSGFVDQGMHDFLFHFAHNETPNADNPCADGGTVGIGVDINGCADHVTVSFLNTSDSFVVNGVTYVFNLLGFSTDGGATITPDYWTEESADNTAGLYASIQTRSSVVPEPGTLALLGLGLFGLSLVRRRIR